MQEKKIIFVFFINLTMLIIAFIVFLRCIILKKAIWQILCSFGGLLAFIVLIIFLIRTHKSTLFKI